MSPEELAAVLAAEPWLRAFVEDGDTEIEVVRERFECSQREAIGELRRDGVEVNRRFVTARGYATTSLDLGGK